MHDTNLMALEGRSEKNANRSEIYISVRRIVKVFFFLIFFKKIGF